MKRTKHISASEFLSKIIPSKLYLIYGTDEYFKEKILKKLLVKYSTPGTEDFDRSILHASNTSIDQLIEQLDTLPFMAEQRVVVIKGLETYSAKDNTKLDKYLKASELRNILIILSEKIDARTSLIKTCQKNGVVIQSKPPYNANDILRWLRMKLSDDNIQMESQAQQLFANSIELDYLIAAMELEKLIIYTKKADRIKLDDVQKCVGISKKNKVFDLQNAIGEASYKKAMQVLENIVANEDANKIGVFIIIMLTRFFTTIWKIHALRAQNISDQEILNQHLPEVFFSFRKDYFKYAISFSTKKLRLVYSVLLETDIKLKSLNVRNEILLSMMIYNIIQIAREKNDI